MRKNRVVLALASAIYAVSLGASANAIMTNISHLSVSPDKSLVAFSATSATGGEEDLWILTLDEQQTLKRLTTHKASDTNPQWLDRDTLVFLSNRTDSQQLWSISIKGGEAGQYSDFSDSVKDYSYHQPTGKFLLELFNKSGSTDLHLGQKEQDAFVLSSSLVEGYSSTSSPLKYETAVSPDGTKLYFSNLDDQGANKAIFELDTSTLALKQVSLNDQSDSFSPQLSSDGSLLAFIAKQGTGDGRYGKLMLFDTRNQRVKEVSPLWGGRVASAAFGRDNRSIFVTSPDEGNMSVVQISTSFGDTKKIFSNGNVRQLTYVDDDLLMIKNDLVNRDAMFQIGVDGYGERILTQVGSAASANAEPFRFTVSSGESIKGFMVKPHETRLGQKHPMVVIMRNNPNGAISNRAEQLWDPQFFAASGVGSIIIDSHGSYGYGVDFSETGRFIVSEQRVEDVVSGLKHLQQQEAWIDWTKTCVLADSDYGFFANRLIASNQFSFACSVTIDAPFDLKMHYLQLDNKQPLLDDTGLSVANGLSVWDNYSLLNSVGQWQAASLLIYKNSSEFSFRSQAQLQHSMLKHAGRRSGMRNISLNTDKEVGSFNRLSLAWVNQHVQ